jgi:hypothetical protein
MTKRHVRFVMGSTVAAVMSLGLAAAGQVPAAPEGVRIAVSLDRIAPLLISADGRTVTFRSPAKDTLRVCFEPREFGRTVCFTVGDVRTGRVGSK